jgi:hypothetical protein
MSSASHKLVVTKPCREEWSSMTNADSGRHCKSCDKIVIDFSVLEDNEIRAFFLKNNHNPVCGRFHKSQVDRIRISVSSDVLNKQIPYWKKFLIIFLICFSSNLYPFDVIMSDHPNLYAQSSTNKAARKKHNSKRAKKIKIADVVCNPGTEIMILGFTQSLPAAAIMPILNIADVKARSEEGKSKPLSSDTLQASENRKQKNSPGQPKSENNNECILPAAVKYRRKRRLEN